MPGSFPAETRDEVARVRHWVMLRILEDVRDDHELSGIDCSSLSSSMDEYLVRSRAMASKIYWRSRLCNEVLDLGCNNVPNVSNNTVNLVFSPGSPFNCLNRGFPSFHAKSDTENLESGWYCFPDLISDFAVNLWFMYGQEARESE